LHSREYHARALAAPPYLFIYFDFNIFRQKNNNFLAVAKNKKKKKKKGPWWKHARNVVGRPLHACKPMAFFTGAGATTCPE
jgi:hypothetical protein